MGEKLTLGLLAVGLTVALTSNSLTVRIATLTVTAANTEISTL